MTAPLLAKPVVLVVDDTPENLSVMSALLKESYRVLVANSGERGLKIAMGDPQPDLILLDIMMPVMDGYQVLQELKSHPLTQTIPVIFLTAKAQEEDEEKGLNLGAVDYITKPISPPIVLARVATHLHLKAVNDFLRDKNEFLEAEVARRTRELQAIQDVTIMAMASLAETRDNDTGNHIRRTQHYVRSLCMALREHPKFAAFLTDKTIDLLFKSAPLHDIGKVGVPDRILLKPGPLVARGVRDHEAPPRARARRGAARRGPARPGGRVPALRQGDCLRPPGALGRLRLSAGPQGRGDTDVGAADGGGRRVRRPDQPARSTRTPGPTTRPRPSSWREAARISTPTSWRPSSARPRISGPSRSAMPMMIPTCSRRSSGR